MKKIIIKTDNLEKDAQEISKLLDDKYDGKIFLINFTQENRFLEIALEVEDFLIYNSYDYIKGVCDLEKSTFEKDDRLTIVPSTIRAESISPMVEQVVEDMADLDEDFDYMLLVVDDMKALSQEEIENFELIDLAGEDSNKTIFDRILALFGVKKDG